MDKHLDARGKGEFTYDYANDMLLFKVKDRDYGKSVDFDNIVVDFDKEGYITGLRVIDASKCFDLTKMALKGLQEFEFNSRVEDKVISIQLKFTLCERNKPKVVQRQDFIREAVDAEINDSESSCTVA